jgi:serine-type D-Ala-D-Ala carboxypeptidase
VWDPLGMKFTSFWPGLDCEQCAPTLTLRSGELYRGKPVDSMARAMEVPSGSAGLFSTAGDLARFAAMILNGGELDGVRILRSDLVSQMFRQTDGAGRRTLGWEAYCPAEGPESHRPCERPIGYGHTGWTGTSLWLNPETGVWVVLLSNRSYTARRPPPLRDIRLEVFRLASSAASPYRGPPGLRFAALSTTTRKARIVWDAADAD